MTKNYLDIKEDIDRIRPKFANGTPRSVTFFGTPYHDESGNPVNLAIRVQVENGDVYGMLSVTAENGGIGATGEDGVYRFIPWPCAAIEVRED